ncbi:tyrosine-type recombinase/integrase [Mycobacterium malmoense]|nr:hypothetical protein BMG05_01110 [Mycobacterium malmoense]QZA20212.1 tyrosine-type recombinase/integrase [Mycobacterium malmoense]UNB96966.1 tyrosine-type recombinase/integrase [Mycobacterium malmoense]
MLENGAAATTVGARLAGIRQFTKWLANEHEIPIDPLLGLNAPKAPIPITPILTDEQIKALIQACQGTSLRCRRDEALVRLLVESAMRVGECVALTTDDVDMARGLVMIRRAKNGRGRVAPFGAQTARSLDRYLRARRVHKFADSKALWLGARTYLSLSAAGVRMTLRERAQEAGIGHLHPHQLRHTAAARWLMAGGTETSLMAIAGWQDRTQLDRYGAHTKAERAVAEARRLSLGDI